MHTKFSRPIRILKKYTAISQNQLPACAKGRFLPGNLFVFYEKQNKFLGSPVILRSGVTGQSPSVIPGMATPSSPA